MRFTVESKAGTESVEVTVELGLLAGYTGRDQEAVRAHIAELAEHGVSAPERVPTVYPVPATRLTHANVVQVCSDRTSGEAEFVLVRDGERLLVGVGSDHTDRRLEEHSVLQSKQTCDKPVGEKVWPYDEVAGHWDEIRLSGEVRVDGAWHPYQDGTLAAMLTPEHIVDHIAGRGATADGAAVFSGTLPIIGGEFRYGSHFRVRLDDPVLGRELVHEYAVHRLPVLDS
ncbi:DUF2848 domain-containing protein [Amycolatopsis taiwanensis]|uniref:DUF2848 domain-containing protein n=1 Tax=Amycolatopsis taiwanensis TaxID=342230 RepID=A0A9W6R244_9PSEU|nr:DUF2848 domain-containing protein [Amycolatopsis taiwanensis]GLY68134.1 hypothetical protein Atai01_47530 [Amycolatopsis taiwanensis]